MPWNNQSRLHDSRATQEHSALLLSHFFKSPHFISSLKLFVTGIREGQNIDYARLSRAYMPLRQKTSRN